MPAGVTRLLPFALLSTALHAVVLVSAPQRLELAMTPPGEASMISMRLVPSGEPAPDPAAQAGVAGAVPNRATDASSDRRSASAGESREQPSAREQSVEPAESPATADGGREPSVEPEDPPDATEGGPKQRPERTASAEPAPRELQDTGASSPGASSPGEPGANKRVEPESAEETTEPQAPHRTARADERPESPRDRDTHAPDPDGSGAEGEADRAQLASRAQKLFTTRFRQQFHYPRLARQRGWEGRVVLGFRVQPDGRITDVEVRESSGRSILDRAAVESLIRIERIPELADHLTNGPLTLEVPVTYRLQSG